MEILIVVALIALIGAIVPLTLNFRKQIDRSNDTKRKKDLSTVRSAMDEFYNDHNRFPTGEEICFDSTGVAGYLDVDARRSCACHICGKKMTTTAANEQMLSYIKEVPCDPSSVGVANDTSKDYIYNYDCNSGSSANPQWYRIYAKLLTSDDPGIVESGCSQGCGIKSTTLNGTVPIANTDYTQMLNNYAVTSSNVSPETGTLSCDNQLHCMSNGGSCITCGSKGSCDTTSACKSKIYYVDSDCKHSCI